MSADNNATNGVIHVINRVMYPVPSDPVPNVVAMNAQFGTLVYALQQGQLLPVLAGACTMNVLICSLVYVYILNYTIYCVLYTYIFIIITNV